MLKHTSNAGGSTNGPANGQVRSNNSNNNNNNTNNNTNSSGLNTTPRNIHLRPQQPLNIATLNSQNGTVGAITNGGSRLPNLLNIAEPPPLPPITATGTGTANPGATTTTTTTATATTPVSPILNHLTPNGLNGIGNNLHTYTNQHIALAHATASANGHHNNNNGIGTGVAPHRINQHHNHHYHHHGGGGVGPVNSTVLSNHNTTANTHPHNYTNYANATNATPGAIINQSKHGPGPREALTSLGLLCLVSLLLALLSLIFLLKISPNAREDALTRSSPEDFIIVYDVTLALCALSLSLNLCCLLVCAIQFLFAVKLVRSPMFDGRDNRYLEKSSTSRTCAVGGFFISIPIFLTGIILYTFNHFHSTPAIITSVLIGLGIIFCGAAMVHNVFVWQKEKTISYRSPPLQHNMSMMSQIGPLTPPSQFMNAHSPQAHSMHQLPPQQQQIYHHATPTHLNFNQSHVSTIFQHPISVTPVSPNHSHGSFNPLTALSSSFMIRPSTATPPTPKPIVANGNCLTGLGSVAGAGASAAAVLAAAAREASGSVSPGLPATLDMSNVTSTSLHELSTLV